ncbi:DNA-binding GntR family transcriptional regulator [Deinococcus metalli]|uniref:GntR family transcriptional regulator n=1 Tax=Deinococcus metalli TaxID=1141878 RepID=A0A7W8KFH2_9DEIO|nr:GntR family transcriptional regulator [Deinococcus metalli]MBB5376783.1 DNA-binding GntR family transcriptional regulator [Deinococcus metalli]GHF45317.1 GntR family transcriptional regulator [Deinococcus metalli]
MFPRTVKTALVTRLRDEIVRGTFAPGERLRLEELADRFEVSTMPIREALSALESEGLVVIRPHRGAHVTSFTAAELRELYEIRAVLEQLATVRAVPHLTPADLTRLQDLVDQMEVPDDAFDVAPFSQLNMAFHQLIYDRAGMPQLAAQIRDLRVRVQHYLHKHLESTNYTMTGNVEHQRLIDLIRAGDATAAGHEMHTHILGTGLKIAEIMEREEALAGT